ncbi:hypothetical protein ACWGKQ_47365 [Streptomyces sp. NPDC054770]
MAASTVRRWVLEAIGLPAAKAPRLDQVRMNARHATESPRALLVLTNAEITR